MEKRVFIVRERTGKDFQNMARRIKSCLEANGGHFQRML
jgi:hypothetical protein